jgi:hypothetical protein
MKYIEGEILLIDESIKSKRMEIQNRKTPINEELSP